MNEENNTLNFDDFTVGNDAPATQGGESLIPFDIDSGSPKIIKVVGVGGGGSNAVKHMFMEGIHNVNFALCNTDRQALMNSDIPVKIQLGKETTKGLGAGNDPNVARQAAEESIEEIKNLFNDGTQMVFITAGMGGGTGTGAAPVIAREAKKMGILTIGIVTIPFLFEKRPKIMQALRGVHEMSKNVDALLVINNERLREIYTDNTTSVPEAFAKADDILSVATKSIAEIITIDGIINLDFRDVKKILKDGGVAIMSTGQAEGEGRVKRAIDAALNSPLLNNNDIYNAKKILLNISYSDEAQMLITEMSEIDAFMNDLNPDIEVIWGQAKDQSLGKNVKITILATGFGENGIPGMGDIGNSVPETVRPLNMEPSTKQSMEEEIMSGYYGTEKENRKDPYKFYVFSPEDLDNPRIIDEVNNSPTYKRNQGDLKTIKEDSKKATQRLKEDVAAAPPEVGKQENTGNTIFF